jgi:hypothetical protein
VWTTITELVVNAFIESLFPGVEHSVGADAGKRRERREKD